MPAAIRGRPSAQNSRYASDVRTFAPAFETFPVTKEGWPPNAGSGVVQTGMSGLLRDGVWSGVNSVGGRRNWDCNNFGVTAAISSTGVSASDAQMTLIDAKIDDGNLASGFFQTVSGRFIFVLEP